MKRILTYAFLISVLAASVSCEKQSGDETNMSGDSGAVLKELGTTKMVFIEPEFTFDSIKEGDQVSHVFVFKNTGDQPLYVRDAKASCGCTTPQWTKDTIAPGGEGKITAQYNSKGRPGDFTKTISVMANTDPEATVVTIKGHVIAAPTEITGPYVNESK